MAATAASPPLPPPPTGRAQSTAGEKRGGRALTQTRRLSVQCVASPARRARGNRPRLCACALGWRSSRACGRHQACISLAFSMVGSELGFAIGCWTSAPGADQRRGWCCKPLPFYLRLNVFILLFLPDISLFSPACLCRHRCPRPQTWGIRCFTSAMLAPTGDLNTGPYRPPSSSPFIQMLMV